MSIPAIQWAREVRGLIAAEKTVLLLLADHAGDAGQCWPSIARLAADACVAERTIQRALVRLCSAGLIKRDAKGGRGNTTTYTLCITPRSTPERVTPEVERVTSAAEERVSSTTERVSSTTERVSSTTERVTGVSPEPSVTPIEPTATPNHTSAAPSKPRPKKPDPMRGFADFWQAYPKKVGKGAAERAWPRALVAAGGDVDAIVGAVKVGLSLGDFDLRENARYCPHPATWLNGKRWLDSLELPPETQPASHGARGLHPETAAPPRHQRDGVGDALRRMAAARPRHYGARSGIGEALRQMGGIEDAPASATPILDGEADEVL